MSKIQLTELGKRAPGSLTRDFRAFYKHIPSGKEYLQQDYPNGRNWVEIVDNAPAPVPPPPPPVIPVPTNLGQSLFVSTQGKTIAAGAVRESITNHFSDVNEAVTASLDGDTIYVYAGVNTFTANMFPAGKTIKWQLDGEPLMRGFTTMITDNGAPINIDIKGNGVFQALSTNCINISAEDTLAHIECKSITGPGGAVVRLAGGRDGCYLKVAETIINTGSNYTLRYELNSNWTIDAKRIENAATGGTFRNAIIVRPGWVGTSIINAETIINTSNYEGRGVVAMQGAVGSKMTINISNKIQSNPLAGVNNRAISYNNYNLTINGDIDGAAGNALYTTTNFAGIGAQLIHNGNAYNDGTVPAVSGSAFLNLVKLNGIYTSSNARVIEHLNGDMEIDGKIVNTKADGGSVGVYVNSGDATIFNNAKIIMTIFDGSEVTVDAIVAKNIKIIHSLVGNADLDTVNITNLIPYSTYNFNANVE